jgi:hypothetical protein
MPTCRYTTSDINVGEKDLEKATLSKRILAVTLIAALCFISIASVHSLDVTIDIVESPITIDEEDIGQLFNVTVRIQNVPADPGAAGVEFKIRWDSSVLEGVSMALPSGHFMEPDGDDGNLWVIKKDINNTISSTEGQAWYAVTFQDTDQGIGMGYLPKSGSGSLAVITFNATAPGETDLHFAVVKVGGPTPPSPPPSVPTTGVDGDVTVVPEFPTFMLPLLFIVATVFAIIFGRKVGGRSARGRKEEKK